MLRPLLKKIVEETQTVNKGSPLKKYRRAFPQWWKTSQSRQSQSRQVSLKGPYLTFRGLICSNMRCTGTIQNINQHKCRPSAATMLRLLFESAAHPLSQEVGRTHVNPFTVTFLISLSSCFNCRLNPNRSSSPYFL